jgi:hypothetical protein
VAALAYSAESGEALIETKWLNNQLINNNGENVNNGNEKI